MIILAANNISKIYDDKEIIENISINVNENEIVSLLGISGVGKSTLFNILSGLIKPDSGEIRLNNSDVTGQTGHVSYMQQKDLLLPFKTIIDNVALPLVIQGVTKKAARAQAIQNFNKFGLDGYENKYPDQLSGGMKQRAALLRTYMFSRDVALLDEPFSALDAITKNAIHLWYLDLMTKIPMSTILITHDIDEAIILSDRIYIMTGIPGKITTEIKIDINKPRSDDFVTSYEFIEYKRKIIKLL